VCPRYTFADGSFIVVIPWFLIPGRPYPVQIYMHACGLYSANPGMGQRAAAKATRAEFGLEKFSHSTVSRSFRAFENSRKQGLAQRFGEEVGEGGTVRQHLVVAAVKGGRGQGEAPETKGRFPSLISTSKRRDEMEGFLLEFLRDCKKMNIEASSRRYVEKWNKKTGRLLL